MIFEKDNFSASEPGQPKLKEFVTKGSVTLFLKCQQGMELSTPVLEKNIDVDSKGPYLLPVSQVWLLATSLPPLYTMPSQHPNGSSSPTQPNCMSAQSLIAKMVCCLIVS